MADDLFLELVTPDEVRTLAIYNAERARGIAHTESWQQKMAEFQERFDQNERRRLAHLGAKFADGAAIVPPPPKRSWWRP